MIVDRFFFSTSKNDDKSLELWSWLKLYELNKENEMSSIFISHLKEDNLLRCNLVSLVASQWDIPENSEFPEELRN